jgi:hypothetical protein
MTSPSFPGVIQSSTMNAKPMMAMPMMPKITVEASPSANES